jgi:pyruvate/2-oxoglutarate dehydrogenase complex dihydrolipoamide dehydrogenase (E3) component
VRSVSTANSRKIVTAEIGARDERFEAEAILVAAGRAPNVTGLGLEQLGVEIRHEGVAVDTRMRTSSRSIYAVGDAAGRFLFTHNAAHEAATAVRDMFFPGSGKPTELVPWCTFTDPELASVGLSTREALERHGDRATRIWRRGLVHSDRARAEGTTDGIGVRVTAQERIVGAQVLAPRAGERIQALALAIREGMKLRDLAGLVHVYPTVATSVQQLAGDAAYEYGRRWAKRLRVGRR